MLEEDAILTKREPMVREIVERLLNEGYNDKQKIIQKTVELTNIPRPTIRRIIRDMRSEMVNKIKILQADYIKPPS